MSAITVYTNGFANQPGVPLSFVSGITGVGTVPPSGTQIDSSLLTQLQAAAAAAGVTIVQGTPPAGAPAVAPVTVTTANLAAQLAALGFTGGGGAALSQAAIDALGLGPSDVGITPTVLQGLLSGAYAALVSPTGDATGAADAALIQPLLSACRTGVGGTVRIEAGSHGGDIYVAAPLVIGSNTRLVFGPGVRLRQATGYNGLLLVSYAGGLAAGPCQGSIDVTVTGTGAPGGVAVGIISNSGGSLAAGTYYWRLTYTTANGETTGSTEVSQAVTAGQEPALSWSAAPFPTLVTGVKVYRGTAAGAENTLVATLAAGATGYTDTGATGTAAAVPATNTAGTATLVASGNANYPRAVFNQFAGNQPATIHYYDGTTQATTATWVDAHHVTVNPAPVNGTQSAYVEIGARDHDVTIEGLNVYGTNTSNESVLRCNVVLSRIDRLTGTRWQAQSTGGLYMFQIADVTSVLIDHVDFPGVGTARDGLHLNGPANDITVRRVTGTTGDDSCPIIPCVGLSIAVAWGPVTNVHYEDVDTTAGVVAGGETLTQWTCDSSEFGNPAAPITVPFTDNISYVRCRPSNLGASLLGFLTGNTSVPLSAGKTTLRDCVGGIVIAPNGEPGNIGELVAENHRFPTPGSPYQPGVSLKGSTVVGTLKLLAPTGSPTGQQNRLVAVNGNGATINDLIIRDPSFAPTAGGSDLVGLLSPGSVINRAYVSGGSFNAGSVYGGAIIGANQAGVTLGEVFISDMWVTCLALLNVAGATKLHVNQVSGYVYSPAFVNATGYTVLIFGGGLGGLTATQPSTLTAACRVLNQDYPCDVSTISRAGIGDRAYNTNASLACGVGPVISSGSGAAGSWKHLVSGATY